MRYGDGTVKGLRLSNPRDPAVRSALAKPCPECKVPAQEWCVGTAEGPTNGRRRSRLHFARCSFDPPEPC